MSRGRQGAPAWSSRLRPLGRCSTQKPAPCAVVVIDEDDDGEASDSEVFIVDADTAGKTFPTTSRCQAKKGEGSSGGNVIDLDDDDVEELSRGDKAGPSAARGAGSPAAATTPGLASLRNRYGLDCTSDGNESDLSKRLESESDDSESEDNSASDCEIMDDTHGTARKMWESAASSRKRMPNGVHKGKEGMATASTSSSGSETQPGENAGGLLGSEFHLDGDFFQFFQPTDNGGPAEDNFNWNTYLGDAQKHEQCSTYGARDAHDPSKNSHAECHINESFQHFSHGDKEADPFTTESAEVDCDPCSGQNANECSNRNVSNGKGPCSSASPILESDTAGNDNTAQFHNGAVPEKGSGGIQSPHLDQTFDDSFVPAKRVLPASSSPYWKDGSSPMSISTPEKMDERVPEEACSRKDQSPSDVHNVASGRCALSQNDLVDDPNGLGQFTLVQEASDSLDGLIGEREKLKETAEFKRAAEEEWASRQRQLQIQAEEAKKLRKRKKAEALRLLDMERKQKQRLQEVRESQKKNEEEIQLKEQYRCKVRKELEDTERRYRDTPSILRVLGIPVDGCQVRAALKQAQVKFHPDRVSRSDIYQQVQAEETFKFISRLKEKLPSFL